MRRGATCIVQGTATAAMLLLAAACSSPRDPGGSPCSPRSPTPEDQRLFAALYQVIFVPDDATACAEPGPWCNLLAAAGYAQATLHGYTDTVDPAQALDPNIAHWLYEARWHLARASSFGFTPDHLLLPGAPDCYGGAGEYAVCLPLCSCGAGPNPGDLPRPRVHLYVRLEADAGGCTRATPLAIVSIRGAPVFVRPTNGVGLVVGQEPYASILVTGSKSAEAWKAGHAEIKPSPRS